MNNPRYVLRSAVFVAVFLTGFLITASIPLFPVAPLVIGGVWLTVQAGYGLRRFDLIMLATAAAVGATVQGAGLLSSITMAIWAVVPALLFAVLLEHRLPGYWRGHGDRFRRPSTALLPLAGIAALTASAGAVIAAVIEAGSPGLPPLLPFGRDLAMLFLVPLAVNTWRRLRSPGRAGLTVVR